MTKLHIKLPITKKSIKEDVITIIAKKTYTREDKKIVSESVKLLIPPTKEKEYTLTIGRLELTDFDQECVFHAYADLEYDETIDTRPAKICNVQGEINAELMLSMELLKIWCDVTRREVETICAKGVHYATNQTLQKLPTHIKVTEESITIIVPQ